MAQKYTRCFVTQKSLNFVLSVDDKHEVESSADELICMISLLHTLLLLSPNLYDGLDLCKFETLHCFQVN